MKIDLTQVAESACAMFWAEVPGRNDSRHLSTKIRESGLKAQIAPEHGECAALIPLLSKLPILCDFVATAQANGHKYKVELFGPALLTFESTSSESSPEE